jgi:hypothetical protein
MPLSGDVLQALEIPDPRVGWVGGVLHDLEGDMGEAVEQPWEEMGSRGVVLNPCADHPPFTAALRE